MLRGEAMLIEDLNQLLGETKEKFQGLRDSL
jgi:hypothetical protein